MSKPLNEHEKVVLVALSYPKHLLTEGDLKDAMSPFYGLGWEEKDMVHLVKSTLDTLSKRNLVASEIYGWGLTKAGRGCVTLLNNEVSK